MSGIKDSERIEELRKRLYERGMPEVERTAHTLSDTSIDVPRVWSRPSSVIATKVVSPDNKSSTQPSVRPTNQSRSFSDITYPASLNTQLASNQTYAASAAPTPLTTQLMSPSQSHHPKSYRLKLLAAGAIFFVLALVISSAMMMFGNNGISGENITITATGPFTIGGGEAMPIQVGLTNSNSVSIESATLIVEYPRGTLSANEERKELFNERLALETVAPGETINVPLRALMFGEENQEQQVNVSVEYRVAGSNALFFKEADPLRYKISSSPLIFTVDTLKKISSGQETDITMTIRSNAQNELRDVLITAEYPQGFSYSSSNPKPSSGQNQWLIKTLAPEQTVSITMKGVVIGKTSDEYAINYAVGVPNERDPQTLASVFATAQTQFEIEEPFLDIDLTIDGVVNEVAVVTPEKRTTVSVDVTNTLSDTIYDIVVEAALGGNAISDLEVGPPKGFYDSATRKIIWDISNAPQLEELAPGKTTRLSFTIAPSGTVNNTPEINVVVNIKARRVSESQVPETLTGTANGSMKVASEPVLRGYATHNSGSFADIGTIPPQAEKATTYTIGFMVDNGTNDISGGIVTATLPLYVTWQNQTIGTGVFSYDKIKRSVTWNIGQVESQSQVMGSFQVSFTPSKSQLATIPTLVEEQFLRADDLFTGTVVRATNPAITTEISTEAGYPRGNGRVLE